MPNPPECHCPACTWTGYYDDCDVEYSNEPRGEYHGTAVSQLSAEYNCPECGEEVEDGAVEFGNNNEEEEEEK